MAELSTLSPDDRRVLQAPATRLARARVAPVLALALPQLANLRSLLPSYVGQSVTDLIDALARWERDETEVIRNAR